MTLGDHLRKRRLDLGISQREMANQLGVDKKSVQTWERNEVRPSRTLAHELRRFLGFDVPTSASPFAARLMAFRRKRRLTHTEVARLLGVHRRTVIRWETGRTIPATTIRIRAETLLGRAQPGNLSVGEALIGRAESTKQESDL